MSGPQLTDDLDAVVRDISSLRRRFAVTAPRVWDPATAAAELAVQTGHLSLCLLRLRGADVTAFDDPARPITDLGDELADVVLAAVSVAVLAGTEPSATATPPRPPITSPVDGFLRILVDAGMLAEAAMIAHGYRHVPTGTPPTVADAARAVLDDAQLLATQLGLDLPAEFRAMVADASAFLDQRGATP